MSRSSVRLAGIAALLVAAIMVVVPLRAYLKVDSCLDGGGSYDHASGNCDFDKTHPNSSPKVSAEVYLGVGIVLALIGGLLVVFSRRIASEPDAV
jgi:hypothetical protein